MPAFIASRADYVEKLQKLAEHIKSHPDEARARIAKMSAEAQQPFGDIVKIFVSDKDVKTKVAETQAIRATLSPAVRAEIDQVKAEVAHKAGILTLEEIIEKLQKLADHIKAHPDEARAKVATLSPAAQKPFGDMVKIFVSDKTILEKRAECQAIQDGLAPEVRGEILALKEELAHKIGLIPQ